METPDNVMHVLEVPLYTLPQSRVLSERFFYHSAGEVSRKENGVWTTGTPNLLQCKSRPTWSSHFRRRRLGAFFLRVSVASVIAKKVPDL